MSKFIHGDCMDCLPEFEDNYFDLAIVDPPYGDDKIFSGSANYANKIKQFSNIKPTSQYFGELLRVSKNQIIWGGNYFELPPNRCFIFWDKCCSVPNYSDGEYAWTSFDSVARCYKYAWVGLSNGIPGRNKKEKSIHPTQKPVQLYRWLLQNYAKPGDLILDTHVGSGSSLVACEMEGFDYTGYEIDKEYYDGATKRRNAERQKISLF